MTGNAFSFSWKYISPKKEKCDINKINLLIAGMFSFILNQDSDELFLLL